MSGLMVPVSIMFTSILACRLILDLRDRGSKSISLTASEQRQMASYTHHHRPVMGPNPHIAPGIRASRVGVLTRDTYGLPGVGAITQMDFAHDPEISIGGELDADVYEDKGEGSSGESGATTTRNDEKRRPRSLSMLGKEIGGMAGDGSDETGETKSELVSDGEVSPERLASHLSRGVMVNVESHQIVDPVGAIQLKTRGRRARKGAS